MKNITNAIQWLIFDSGTSGYEISKRTGISATTIHRLRKGRQPINHLSLSNALKLFKLADELRRDIA